MEKISVKLPGLFNESIYVQLFNKSQRTDWPLYMPHHNIKKTFLYINTHTHTHTDTDILYITLKERM